MKKDSIDEDKFERLLQLSGKTIILGITGGIAAYKSCDLASRLRQLGANVHVVMTPNAKEFITPLTLKTITRNPVHCEQFQDEAEWRPEHIELAARADLILIAPATANSLPSLPMVFATIFCQPWF